MAWDMEKWQPSNELAETDDTSAFDEPEIVDADWSYVEPEPAYDVAEYEVDDDYDNYALQPEPEPQQNGWGWGGSLVEYEEPSVVDVPFSFLQPDESQLPVKRSSWGWGGSTSNEIEPYEDDTTSEEIERYTSAWFESDPDTVDADYEYIDPETRGLENPYQRSTDDFFRTVEVGENPEPAPSFNPFAGFFGQSSTSQKNDTWQGSSNKTSSNSKPKQRNDSSVRSHASTHQSTGSFTGSSTNNATGSATGSSTSNRTRNHTQPQTQTRAPLSAPNKTQTIHPQKGVKPSDRGKGGADKDYPWYFLAYPDPREDEDVQYLRYWYLFQQYSEGVVEWDEPKFHDWIASLKGADRDLYVDAGKQVADQEVFDQLQDGTLKKAMTSMRLEGDDGAPAYKDPVGHFSAWVLRGFS
jgi:hypothetical protein